MSRQRIARGLSASWFRFLVTISLNLFQLPILNACFDRAVLGIYLLFATLSMFLSLTDLGLGNVLSRAVAYATGAEQGDRSAPVAPLSDLIPTGMAAYVGAGLLLVLLGLPLGQLYFGSVQLPVEAAGEIRTAWLLFLVASGLNLVSMAPFSCLSGLGEVSHEPLIRTGVQLGRLGAIAVLAPLTHSVVALVVAELVLNAAMLGMGAFALARKHAGPLVGRPRWDLMRRMYAESMPLFVSRLGGLMILETTPVVVSLAMGPAAVPDFVALKQLTYLGIGIPASVATAFSPFAAAAFSAGDRQRLLDYYSLTLRLTLALALLWLVGFLVWAPSLVDLWLGKGHFLGYAVVLPLAVMALLEAHHNAHAAFAWSSGRWPFAPWGIASGVLTIALCLVGGRLAGYMGIAMGSMVAQLVTNNWYVVTYTLAHLQVRLATYLRDTALPALAFAIAIAVPAVLSVRLLEGAVHAGWMIRGLEGTRLVSMLAGGLVTVLCAFGCFWLLLLRDAERQWLWQRVPRRLRILDPS